MRRWVLSRSTAIIRSAISTSQTTSYSLKPTAIRLNPLVIQGPGAGPEVTAGGVFADLLRLASFLSTGQGYVLSGSLRLRRPR